MSDNFEKVKHAIVDKYAVDEDKITPRTRFKEDLGFLPINIVKLSEEIDEFKGELSYDKAKSIRFIGELVNYIDETDIINKIDEAIMINLPADEYHVIGETNFRDDLNFDTEGIVNLTKRINLFGVEISYKKAEKIKTVGDLAKYINISNPNSTYFKISFFESIRYGTVWRDWRVYWLGICCLGGSIFGGYYGLTQYGWIGSIIGVILGFVLGVIIFLASMI